MNILIICDLRMCKSMLILSSRTGIDKDKHFLMPYFKRLPPLVNISNEVNVRCLVLL